ncbi:hypothetical protein BU15DRAFT_58431 [Melanogaster broomeanus]|nr:hypothetical protein BU15DRAFT_58431 [Melanogaster broomeanus]
MAFSSENMHPPKGWKPPTRHNAWTGPALFQDWPSQFKYPPLPFGHPLAASMCCPPIVAPHVTSDATVAGPSMHIQPHNPGASSSVPSTNPSPFQSPALFASVSSFTPLSSHAGINKSPVWTQVQSSNFMSSNFMPSVCAPDLCGAPVGPYYTDIQQGTTAPCIPKLNHPLSLDTVNLPMTVHGNSSVPTSITNTPCLLTFEDLARSLDPAPHTGLPSSYEFTFTCDPQLQSQEYGESTLLQQEQGHFWADQQNLAAYPGSNEVSLPPVPASEQPEDLCAENFSSMEEFLAALFAPEIRQAQLLDRSPYAMEDPSFPLAAQPDSTFFPQYQDPAGPQSQPSYSHYPSHVQQVSASESHPAPHTDDIAAALILSVIAPPAKKKRKVTESKTCNSPDDSTSVAAAHPTGTPYWQGDVSSTMDAGATTRSIHPPGYLPTQQPMPVAGPSQVQCSSCATRTGSKRPLEIDDGDSDLESDTEGHPRRVRVVTEGDGDKRCKCHTCDKWILHRRKKYRKGTKRHSKGLLYGCRICLKLKGRFGGHSRKDSLKRHILQGHKEKSLKTSASTFPGILDPYDENEGPQDWEVVLNPMQH